MVTLIMDERVLNLRDATASTSEATGAAVDTIKYRIQEIGRCAL